MTDMSTLTADAGGVRVLPASELADVPGLLAGITVRVAGGREGRGGRDDFGLSTGGTAWDVASRYEALARGLGFPAAAVCRQVHGTSLAVAEHAPAAGLWIPGEADGFIGWVTGRLFAVTVADCVPVYLVDTRSGTFGLLHAGWRGASAGILGRALDLLADRYGRPADAYRVHLGPSICGDCYEVGPEVPGAFGRRVSGKSYLDVGAELIAEAVRAGVPRERVTRSKLCTKCDATLLHSHRGGGEQAGRMAAYIGWKG